MTHVHVGLVVPGLDVEEDGGLGDHLRLLGLLLVVGLQPLLGDPLLLLVVLLLVRPKQIHVVVVLLCRSRGGLGSRSGAGGSVKFVHSGLQGEDQRLEVVRH